MNSLFARRLTSPESVPARDAARLGRSPENTTTSGSRRDEAAAAVARLGASAPTRSRFAPALGTGATTSSSSSTSPLRRLPAPFDFPTFVEVDVARGGSSLGARRASFPLDFFFGRAPSSSSSNMAMNRSPARSSALSEASPSVGGFSPRIAHAQPGEVCAGKRTPRTQKSRRPTRRSLTRPRSARRAPRARQSAVLLRGLLP